MSDNMTKKRILNVKSPTIVDSYYEDEDFQKELDKVSDDILINAETNRTIKNIRKTLASALKKKYGFTNGELKELTSKILKIHGLEASNFDALSSFAKILESRVNDVSIDDNSNKNEKTIAGVNNEITAAFRKLVGYHMLYGVMKDLYGQAEAKVLSGDLYDFSLGLSDSTNILIPYCWALDASKIVLEGRKFGQLPSAPVHRVDSYISALDETTHQMSSHLAGAIAVGTFFLDIAHILIYKQRVPFEKIKTDAVMRKHIENCFQTFVHSVNHLSRNGVESPFTNISLFDRVKLKGLVGPENYGWYFANKKEVALDNGLEDKMSAEQWQEFVINYIIELQEIYAKFHEKGDPLNNGIPYRFPVTTMNISKDDDDKVLDEKFFDFVCQRDITRFNIFTSKGTKVASCCFSGDQPILVRNAKDVYLTTFKDWKNTTPYAVYKDNWKVFHNGSWVEANEVVLPSRQMYKVTTTNNKTIIVSDNHLHVTYNGEIPTSKLTTDDYLMFNTKPLQSYPEKDEGLTYKDGYLIGAFIGDGSFGGNIELASGNKEIYTINLSLNKNCYQEIINDIGLHSTYSIFDDKELVSVRICSKEKVAFIKRFVNGCHSAYTKELNPNVLFQSLEFRKGILDGWYATDGGNSNRCYTISPKLRDSMELLITSLGYNSTISVSDRTGEVAFINEETGKEYYKNYPLWCVRWYDSSNKRTMKDVYKWKNNSMYFKIKSIEKVDYNDENIYCFEMKNKDEPYFTLPNGIITHNCRLINDAELLDMGSSVNSFGGSTVSMGSHRVVTINFARIAYEANSMEDFYHILDKRIRGAAKVLKAHKVLIGKMEEKGLEPFITRGWIRMDRLFSTFGILGVVEAKKILETKFADQIEDGQDVMKDYLVYLNKHSQEYAKELGLFSNIEQIPGESYAVRLATVDNLIFDEDIIDAPLYANQFVPLWEDATIWEKLEADGKYNQLLTGGGIVHAQLGSKTTPSQNRKIIEYAIKCGCEHFVLNSVYSKCPKCGAVYDHKVASCSKCGHNEHMEYFTRVVGFFVPVDCWNPTRRNWEFERRTFIDDSLHN